MITLTSNYPSISVSVLRPHGRWLLSGLVKRGRRPIAAFTTYPAARLVVFTALNTKAEVKLEATALTFGSRWWFRCPWCGRRCSNLYFRPMRGCWCAGRAAA